MNLEFVEHLPSSGKKASGVVFLLHGYGSNCSDLISLVPELGENFSDIHFISPNAPFIHDSGFPGMYQWYSLTRMNDSFLYEGAKTAEPILIKFFESQLKRLDIPASRAVVCGFSQGGMMTLHTFLRYSKKLAGIISLSGYISGAKFLNEEIKTKQNTLLIHGDLDNVVPTSSFYSSKEILEELNVPLEAHMLEGLAHGINYEAIKLTASFLKKAFA